MRNPSMLRALERKFLSICSVGTLIRNNGLQSSLRLIKAAALVD